MSVKEKAKKIKKKKLTKKPKKKKYEYWVPIYNETGMIVAYTAVVLKRNGGSK